MLAAINGLYRPGETPSVVHCTYNEAKIADDTIMQEAKAIVIDDAIAKAARGWLKKHVEDFCDIVCLVAFMFRQRGHHYIEDMDERYKTMWRRCERDEAHNL